jgi:hypothetical protein
MYAHNNINAAHFVEDAFVRDPLHRYYGAAVGKK